MDDPIGKWCCNERGQQYEQQYDAPEHMRGGKSSRISKDIQRNVHFIIRIQAFVRGMRTRQLVSRIREEKRVLKAVYFPDVDYYETLSDDRSITRALFYPENEKAMQQSLVYHRY